MRHVMMSIYEKVERIFGYRQLTLHLRSQTRKTINIEAYIHFYSNERLQAKLNGLSPMEYRTKTV
ncbi:hypothetical protein B4V02_08025 [Paenibacillus kribbensis]|uniref:Integrase catalytic domain-containing protein n=2 Tax=Paenibacillus kribbensis TaxID=172713 RepID=A0A222WKF8_9BACL|nr:hypothetical protein B4V02_08025 [Paenibacillus kribbensis]